MASSQRGYLHQDCRSDNMPASTTERLYPAASNAGQREKGLASELTGQVSPHCERVRNTGIVTALSVSQKFILLVSDKGRALGRGRNQPLTLLHQSLRLHPADTPTSPGLGESEMTQGPDVLLSRESADADTEGREHLEFCLFSSTKTSTAQKKGARPWAAPS